MANETPTQQVLELKHHMPIEAILRAHLEKHRARRTWSRRVAPTWG